ncbi:glutamate racemase [Candidatus Nomurabacteria bacterium]|nr:glutamate racemase [Candidatus Nomurabacteria bacterium]MCB9819194.1 glutamate racemase [Candidatus Nomurabacteria bacterium]
MTEEAPNVQKAGKIGFFDSGLGGLTILKVVAKELPQYDYVYYGDTANLPLGDKTEEEIYQLTKAGVEALFKKDCLLVVIACNTASAETLRRLQDGFLKDNYPDRRILGVVIPTVEALINSDSTSTLLIATKRTVESGKYALELQNRSPRKIKLYSVPTPELVPLIESGDRAEALSKAIVTIEEEKGSNQFDTVILGCTHYTKLKDGLRAHFNSSLKILSQDEIIPNKLVNYLERHPELESHFSQGSTRTIHLTLHRPDYDNALKELLGGVII